MLHIFGVTIAMFSIVVRKMEAIAGLVHCEITTQHLTVCKLAVGPTSICMSNRCISSTFKNRERVEMNALLYYTKQYSVSQATCIKCIVKKRVKLETLFQV